MTISIISQGQSLEEHKSFFENFAQEGMLCTYYTVVYVSIIVLKLFVLRLVNFIIKLVAEGFLQLTFVCLSLVNKNRGMSPARRPPFDSSNDQRRHAIARHT